MAREIRAPFNLYDDDAVLLMRLKEHFDEKTGVKMSSVNVVRIALRLLAKKEGFIED